MTNKEILLDKHQLMNESKYSYCFLCIKRFSDANKDYKSHLSKLIYIKNLIIYQTKDGEKKAIDDYYLCPSCKSRLSVDDFMEHYTLRSNGKKWSENGDNLAGKSV